MESIADVVDFCKDQAAFHAKKAGWRNMKPEAAASHRKLSEQFQSAAEVLLHVPAKAATALAVEHEQHDLFSIDPFDLGGLPDELVSELAISRADQEDAQIIQLFRIARRPLNINEVMIGLFRKFQVQSKRTALSARLYRMATRNDLINVEKGVYALPATKEIEFEKDESPL